jgi:hypothetical protein
MIVEREREREREREKERKLILSMRTTSTHPTVGMAPIKVSAPVVVSMVNKELGLFPTFDVTPNNVCWEQAKAKRQKRS